MLWSLHTQANCKSSCHTGNFLITHLKCNGPCHICLKCQIDDIIGVKEKTTSKLLIENNIKNNQVSDIPNHLKFDNSSLEARVLDYCERSDVSLQLDELLVIEYYSRR